MKTRQVLQATGVLINYHINREPRASHINQIWKVGEQMWSEEGVKSRKKGGKWPSSSLLHTQPGGYAYTTILHTNSYVFNKNIKTTVNSFVHSIDHSLDPPPLFSLEIASLDHVEERGQSRFFIVLWLGNQRIHLAVNVKPGGKIYQKKYLRRNGGTHAWRAGGFSSTST